MRGLARHAAAALLALVGTGLLLTPATAADLEFSANTPSALALQVSSALVPTGTAEVAYVLPAEPGAEQWTVASALAATPGPGVLLLTPTSFLDNPVRDELRRVSDGNLIVHLVGPFSTAVSDQLTSSGYVVDQIAEADATATAVALARQTYGAPAGTHRRLLLVPDDPAFATTNALAAVAGVGMSIPVIPIGAAGTSALDAPLFEVLVVAPASAIPDSAVEGFVDGPSVRRIWDDDPSVLAGMLSDLMVDEPRDGDLAGPDVYAPIMADQASAGSGLVAALVAARRALDGQTAPLLLVDGVAPADPQADCDAGAQVETTCRVAAADGPVTWLSVTSLIIDGPDVFRSDEEPTLASTGGGQALAGAAALGLALVVLASGRRRRPV